MDLKKIIEVFISENMPEIKNASKLADYFISDIEKRGLLGEEKVVVDNAIPIFSYSDGQKARVRKKIVSGDLEIEVGTIVTKRGNVYFWPKTPTENYDIPANQVEGNGEFFEFPDGNGNYITIDNIIKMIPTPSLN